MLRMAQLACQQGQKTTDHLRQCCMPATLLRQGGKSHANTMRNTSNSQSNTTHVQQLVTVLAPPPRPSVNNNPHKDAPAHRRPSWGRA
jgi:hypothetical protein